MQRVLAGMQESELKQSIVVVDRRRLRRRRLPIVATTRRAIWRSPDPGGKRCPHGPERGEKGSGSGCPDPAGARGGRLWCACCRWFFVHQHEFQFGDQRAPRVSPQSVGLKRVCRGRYHDRGRRGARCLVGTPSGAWARGCPVPPRHAGESRRHGLAPARSGEERVRRHGDRLPRLWRLDGGCERSWVAPRRARRLRLDPGRRAGIEDRGLRGKPRHRPRGCPRPRPAESPESSSTRPTPRCGGSSN